MFIGVVCFSLYEDKIGSKNVIFLRNNCPKSKICYLFLTLVLVWAIFKYYKSLLIICYIFVIKGMKNDLRIKKEFEDFYKTVRCLILSHKNPTLK